MPQSSCPLSPYLRPRYRKTRRLVKKIIKILSTSFIVYVKDIFNMWCIYLLLCCKQSLVSRSPNYSLSLSKAMTLNNDVALCDLALMPPSLDLVIRHIWHHDQIHTLTSILTTWWPWSFPGVQTYSFYYAHTPYMHAWAIITYNSNHTNS